MIFLMRERLMRVSNNTSISLKIAKVSGGFVRACNISLRPQSLFSLGRAIIDL
jgi:hypothetical protein